MAVKSTQECLDVVTEVVAKHKKWSIINITRGTSLGEKYATILVELGLTWPDANERTSVQDVARVLWQQQPR